MAQHDYDIANQTFPSFRSDLNSVLEAINTSNSGTSRPSSAVAGTIWLDTTNATNPTLKLYDGADDISLATFDYSANTVNWIDSTVVFDIVNDTTPQLGGNLDVNGNSLVSTANGNITFTPDGTGKVVISGLSFPTADGTSGQAIVTDGCGNLSFASVEGRTGTVNWDTTAKTSGFTATDGEGYFCNTTSSAFTVTLPSGTAGAIVSLADYAGTWQTNNLTVSPNASDKIGGVNQNAVLNTEGQSVTFVYVDSTQGWINTMDSTSNVRGENLFIVACGGTETTSGDYKIHTFTSPGTFTVTNVGSPAGSDSVDYLVVAGGGGAAGANTGNTAAGGAGAGGFREGYNPGSYTASPLATTALPISATSYPITVGSGGTGVGQPGLAPNGSNSIFSTITSAGGGGSGSKNLQSSTGGSGAGGTGNSFPCGAAGNTPPTSPPQGQPGGGAGAIDNGGGGGGAGATGGNASPSSGGNGATGVTTSINASPVTRAGGGGGGAYVGCGGTGGSGGGGAGSRGIPGTNGTVNTGGGGGGAGSFCGQPPATGGNGGSGIVIIRYKFQ